MRDAILEATVPDCQRTSLAACPRQLQIAFSVPAEWIDQRAFDHVQIRLVGRVKTKVDFTVGRAIFLSMAMNRSRAKFRPLQVGRQGTSLSISLASFNHFPPSMLETGRAYFARSVGLGGKHVHGECDISYHVEARVWRGPQLVHCFATDISLPKPTLLALSMAAPWQASAVPTLPRFMRKAFSGSRADLLVKIPNAQALEFRRDAGQGARSIRVPITVVQRGDTGAVNSTSSSPLCGTVEARWYVRKRISTLPLKKTSRQVPLVDYTVRTDRQRLAISFPPFSYSGDERWEAHDGDQTTTTHVNVRVPASIDMPSVSCDLFERSYRLKLTVSIDAGGDSPQQTASGTIPVAIGAHEAGAGSWSSASRSSSDAGLAPPPPSYANAMNDPILLEAMQI